MTKSVLRIVASRTWELPFIKMSIDEADGQVDTIVVVEHDYTHTGEPHDTELAHYFEPHTYLPNGTELVYAEVSSAATGVRPGRSTADLHYNESLMRGSFEQVIEIQNSDTILCVDADEVIYRSSFPGLISTSRRWWDPRPRSIRMHQFYYRMNYLWTDISFASAAVGPASALRRMRTPWRDARMKTKEIHGCHFSWQLTVAQMVQKLHSYSHSLEYRHLAEPALLQRAISEKKYPFDPERSFTIRELAPSEYDTYFPRSWRNHAASLTHLLPSL